MEDLKKKVVEIGSRVTIKMDDKTRIITIVELGKVNTEKGFISLEAPLAKVLLGAEKGNILNFVNPIGKLVYIEVLEIE
jgi:transcription elongation GreA/GreB family factor